MSLCTDTYPMVFGTYSSRSTARTNGGTNYHKHSNDYRILFHTIDVLLCRNKNYAIIAFPQLLVFFTKRNKTSHNKSMATSGLTKCISSSTTSFSSSVTNNAKQKFLTSSTTKNQTAVRADNYKLSHL